MSDWRDADDDERRERSRRADEEWEEREIAIQQQERLDPPRMPRCPCATCEGVDPDDGRDAPCPNCDGEGSIVTCIDDLCYRREVCIHGDPPTICPECKGTGRVDCDDEP